MSGERFQPIRSFSHSLELAVKPVDGVTGRPFGRDASVSVDGVHVEPVLNPSDYWLYFAEDVSLAGDSVEVTVEAGRQYVDATYEVPIPDDGPGVEVLHVPPNGEYVFGPDATLLVGEVERGGQPVSDARVSLERTDLETRTDPDGEFVLPIRGFVRLADAGSEALRFDPDDDEDDQGDPKPITITVWDEQNTEYDPVIRAEDDGDSTTREVTIPVDERTELDDALEL